MPMDPLPLWQQAFADLKPDKSQGGGWTSKFADAVDQRVTNKLGVVGVVGSVQFTFNKSIFESLLKPAVPVPAAPAGAQLMAAAWQAALTASQLVVPPGSSLGVPSPVTTWSVVSLSIILPPSVIAAANGAVMTIIAAAPPVPDAMASQMPIAFFQGFSLLQASVIGLNSQPPPTGPLPLPLPTAPVI